MAIKGLIKGLYRYFYTTVLCNAPPLKLLKDLNDDLLGLQEFHKGGNNEIFRAVGTRIPAMAKLLQDLFFNKGHILDMAL